ncbi:MAG: glycosyltransferase [Pseudoxanthomonas sp.]
MKAKPAILIATFPIARTGPHLSLQAMLDDDRFRDAFDAQVWHVPDRYRGPRGKLSLLRDARATLASSGKDALVYLNLDMSLAFWLCIAFKLAGAKTLVAHSHNSHFSSPSSRWRRFLFKCVISGLTDVHAAVCQGSAKAMFLGDPARVLLVPSFIDFEALHRQAAVLPVRVRAPGDRFVFACIGRLMAQKNQSLAIRALAGLRRAGRDVELLLLGEGEDRAMLESLAKAEGVADRVVLTGVSDNVGAVCRGRIDALLLPSLYEGQVRIAAEAQSFGLPMAISAGIADVALLDDVGVIKGLPLEVAAWEAAMQRLMDMPRGRERPLEELNRHRLSSVRGAAAFYEVLLDNARGRHSANNKRSEHHEA